MFLEWSFILKYPSVARAARQSQLRKSAKPHLLLLLLSSKRPTARLVGPEAVIHSPNRFVLPCAGPFHKINAGYEAATTTVNSSCPMHGYYFDAILLKLTRDNGAALRMYMYACAHMRVLRLYDSLTSDHTDSRVTTQTHECTRSCVRVL